MRRILFLLFLCSGFSQVNAQTLLDDIDVLFVFDATASVLIQDKAGWVEANQDLVNGYMAASGVGHLDFDFRALETLPPYNSTGDTSLEVIEWMSGPVGHAFWAANRGDNDLVVMVVASFSGNTCGRTVRVENDLDFMNGNTAFFVAIQIYTCHGSMPQLIAHELGHALYADHQVLYDSNGFIDVAATIAALLDDDIYKIEPFNHAWSDQDNEHATIMGQSIHTSKTSPYFSSGNTSRGETPSTHNVTKMFGTGYEPWGPVGDRSWSTVAAYRWSQPPKASKPKIDFPYFVCFGKSPNWDLTWWEDDPRYTNAQFVVEYQQYGSTWYPWYEGVSDCVFSPGGGVTYRVKVVVPGYEDSDWEYATLYGNCNGGGGGPF